MVGYINNNAYSNYPNQGQQYAQNFGMAQPLQNSQQFSGVATPQTLADPSHEPGFFESVFSPFSLVFLPLMLSDHSVKGHINDIAKANGLAIKKTGKLFVNPLTKKQIFGWAECTKTPDGVQQITKSNLFSSIKKIDFGNIWKTSVTDVHNKELYTSFIKQGKTADQIADIAHGAGKATPAQKDAIIAAIKERGAKGVSQNALGNGFRSLVGEGAIGKFARRIPVASTILFGAMEIPEIMAASKFGTAETIKQVGKSALTVGGDVVAFSAGTSAGASIGATIGTALFPGIGTIIGGALGGLVGGMAASHVSRKVIGGAYEMIFGKAKHKEAEAQEAIAAQQEQQQTVQPAAFGTYTQPQQQAAAPQFQGAMPTISLGDENMMSNMNNAYNMYQFAA